MRVIVGCEESQVVAGAFRKLGHEAYSCDLKPTRGNPEWHYQCDVFEVVNEQWDLGIFHPECTCVSVSGNRWYAGTQERLDAIDFIERLWDATAHIPGTGFENPVGVLPTMSKLGKASQYIQPWMFGHGETKRTGLWLRNLPLLVPTNVVEGREQKVWKMAPGENRKRDRSTTYEGIAMAMAEQWGNCRYRLSLIFP